MVKQAKKAGIDLRQSYMRVGKKALIAHQRYAHAKQYKWANQIRRWFSSLAYVLIDAQQRISLGHIEFANATAGTIRLNSDPQAVQA